MAVQTSAVSVPSRLSTAIRPSQSLWRNAWTRLLSNKAAVAGSLVILVFLLIALFAPILAPYNPLEIHDARGYLPPVWVRHSATGAAGDPAFILGTDSLGRDVLSRVLYGARISMVVGFVPVTIILLIGVPVGLIAGYLGGRTDNLLMRLADILIAFPDLLFFIIVMTALRDTGLGKLLNGLLLLFVALSIVNWVNVARLMRSQVLSLKEKEFVEAARSLGSTRRRIMVRHILPNSLSPLIVAATFAIPNMIITEAILGFLGIGLRPSTNPQAVFITSWGAMLLEGQSAINAQPWLLLVPALCVALIVLAFNYVGDGLRDAFDPRMKL